METKKKMGWTAFGLIGSIFAPIGLLFVVLGVALGRNPNVGWRTPNDSVIFTAVFFLWNPSFALLGGFLYYILIGFALSRFVTASYTNAVFDRFINPNIEGAKVNQGLHKDEDDEEDETAEGETDN